MEFLAPTLNFLVVAFILGYFGRKPMMAFLANRSDTFSGTLKEAETRHSEAEKALRTWETSTRDAEAHAKAQLEDAKSALKRQRESALVRAKSEAERVTKESRLVGQSEAVKAKDALQREVAAKSVQLAETYLTGHLTDKDRQKLVGEYVEILGNGAT